MTKREELLEQQRRLHVVFEAWMNDKKQREILTFERENGDIVRHHPDGREEIIVYGKQ
ncbi:hypothetical protein [Neisseria sp.]|uniref:hypothetical protein n=1 Tax=Neisseria sp. TaxID=192066 RepID=UPI0026DAA767|nr:hypothetical protein [Neisseria sp.]MDO4907668.1 hypothetical protein [Neisseria sp.]